jgi:hypothetical protein
MEENPTNFLTAKEHAILFRAIALLRTALLPSFTDFRPALLRQHATSGRPGSFQFSARLGYESSQSRSDRSGHVEEKTLLRF